MFSALGCLAALGGGFSPAVQALALELYVNRNKQAMADEDEEGRRRGKGKKREVTEVETGRRIAHTVLAVVAGAAGAIRDQARLAYRLSHQHVGTSSNYLVVHLAAVLALQDHQHPQLSE